MAEERRVIVTYEVKGTGQFSAAAQELQRTLQVEKDMKKGNEEVARTYKVVVGSIKEMNQNVRTLQASMRGLQDATGKVAQADREEAAAIKNALAQQRQAIQVQKELTAARKEAAAEQPPIAQAAGMITQATAAQREESAALRESTEALIAKSQAQDEALAKEATWRAGFQETKSSIQSVTGSTQQMQANLRNLQGQLSALTASNRTLTESEKGQAAALRQTIDEQRRAVQAQKELENANRAGYLSIGRIIKQFIIWRVIINTISQAYTNLKQSLEEAFTAVYENTEEYKRLAEAKERARNALILLLAPQEKVKEIMDDTAGFLERLADDFITLQAKTQAWTETITDAEDALWSLYNLGRAFAEEGVSINELIGGAALGPAGIAAISEDMKRVGERYAELENERLKAQGKFTDAQARAAELYAENNRLLDESVEEKEKDADITKRLISLSKQWDDELERHADRIREIVNITQTARGEALGEYIGDIIKINADLAKKIQDINDEALEDRNKALAKANKARAKAEKDANDDLEKMQAEHDMQMRHAREAYHLSMVQSERAYQYERGMLVAEGDVLAIEDLDARHEMEQETQQENFELQQRQQEEMFQLQLKYQKEAMREMLADLKNALAEQLAEIEENRREDIAEAERDAEEKRKQRTEEYRVDLEKAKAHGIELLALEEERHREAREKAAEGLAELAAEYEIGLGKVTSAWRAVYGPDGELDRITADFYRRQQERAQQFEQGLSSGDYPTSGPGYNPYAGRGRGYQYGGEFIATKPTTMVVGEGHAPERVVVQPLSFTGGTVDHRWSGGPIPVHGSGLGGADTSGLSAGFNTFAQHLLSQMSSRLGKLRGRRGY